MAEPQIAQRHDRTALILYGSETGNSQDVAQEMGRMAERLHFMTRVCEMDLVEITSLPKYTIVLFAVSTTGQGEFPENARKLWKSLLRKRLPPGCLSHVSYTTFGLGDSSYAKFNWSARKLHKRLAQLGAQEVYPRGEADEQHDEGIDGTFLSWSADLRKRLLATYPLPEGASAIDPEAFLPPKFKLIIAEDESDPDQSREILPPPGEHGSTHVSSFKDGDDKQKQIVSQDQTPSLHSTMKSPPRLLYIPPKEVETETPVCDQLKQACPDAPESLDPELPPNARLPIEDTFPMWVLENKRLTPENHWQDVREITFLMEDEINLIPGDSAKIYPKNFPQDVQALIDLQGWQYIADEPLKFNAEGPDFHGDEYLLQLIPPTLRPLPKSTLRQLLIHNLDITAIPRRSFFENIANHTTDPMHRERLLEFANPVFTDEFYDYTSRPRRSILEVLQDFPSVKIPWKWVASIFPLIRGRKYSISSGGALQDSSEKGYIKVQILVAIVKYKTVLKKVRQGLCSRYLAALQRGSCISASFNEENENTFFRYVRKNPACDTILVCAGTGLAPIRSLLWERQMLNTKNLERHGNSFKPGKNILIYGGRNKNADFFYQKEWENVSMRTHVLTAFSRDQKEKHYVQDVIRENGKLLYDVIMGRRNACIFVCGSSGNMPKSVRKAFVDVFCDENRASEEIEAVADEMLKVLEMEGRYIQETW